MKSETINEIRRHYEKQKEESRPYKKLYRRLKELQNNKLVREYEWIKKALNNFARTHDNYTYMFLDDRDMIRSSYLSYLSRIRSENEPADIYVYGGIHNTRKGTMVKYINLEDGLVYDINLEQKYDFQIKHNVFDILPSNTNMESSLQEYFLREQEEYINNLILYGEETAYRIFSEKYERYANQPIFILK